MVYAGEETCSSIYIGGDEIFGLTLGESIVKEAEKSVFIVTFLSDATADDCYYYKDGSASKKTLAPELFNPVTKTAVIEAPASQSLNYIFAKNPKIRSIKVRNLYCGGKSMIGPFMQLQSLETVELDGCFSTGNALAIGTFVHSTAIKTYSVKNSYIPNFDLSFVQLGSSDFSVESVVVKDCQLGSSSIAKLCSGMTSLETVTLENISFPKRSSNSAHYVDMSQTFYNCAALEKIDLTHIREYENFFFQVGSKTFKGCTSLREIALRGNQVCYLEPVVNNGELEDIDLSDCPLTQDSLSYLVFQVSAPSGFKKSEVKVIFSHDAYEYVNSNYTPQYQIVDASAQ